MTLKSLIFPLAFLATACISKVERVQTPIVFNPVVGNEVRSTDMSVPFPEDKTFGVWASGNKSVGTFIADKEICCTDGVWVSESLPFWPSNSSLRFLAYSPYGLQMQLEDGNLVMKGFDVHKNDTEVLFATTPSGLTSEQGEVKLPFTHALSKLDVRVANRFGSEIDLRIDRIALKGVAMRGDFNSSRHPYWKVDESTLEDVLIFDSERDGQFLAGTTMQFIGGVHAVIPQGLEPYFELVYAFRVDEGEWIDGQQESVQLRGVYWEPGRYYTYSLGINEEKVSYTTGIGHWNGRK